MNCAEFIGIVKSGQPILFRRHSKEYIRLAENSLSIVSKEGFHFCLWLAANRKFKRVIRSGTLFSFQDFPDTTSFLNRWEEMRVVRDWSLNFPGLTEIATFVYMTLIPEYWTIYLEREGQPVEEALPLVEHESMHSDMSGYDG